MFGMFRNHNESKPTSFNLIVRNPVNLSLHYDDAGQHEALDIGCLAHESSFANPELGFLKYTSVIKSTDDLVAFSIMREDKNKIVINVTKNESTCYFIDYDFRNDEKRMAELTKEFHFLSVETRYHETISQIGLRNKRILNKFEEIIRQFDLSSKKINEVIHKIITLLESEILDLKRLSKKFPPEQVARFTF